jgi:hypothetical protein
MDPLQTIPRGGKPAAGAPTFGRIVTNAMQLCSGFVHLTRTPASLSVRDFPQNRPNVAVLSHQDIEYLNEKSRVYNMEENIGAFMYHTASE